MLIRDKKMENIINQLQIKIFQGENTSEEDVRQTINNAIFLNLKTKFNMFNKKIQLL